MAGIWKKIASYIFDVTLEKRQSVYSGELTVSVHKGEYKLSTQNAVYSFGNEYTSFSTAFKTLNLENRNVENVLVLGFGLGSVVDLLRNNSSVKRIVAVEADEVVIELAKKYLHANLQNNVEFQAADAMAFTQYCTDTFDLVIFDVFIDDKTPVELMQCAYLLMLKNLVADNGMLLYSKLETSGHSKIENEQFSKSFSSIFEAAYSITTSGNRVYVWDKNSLFSSELPPVQIGG